MIITAETGCVTNDVCRELLIKPQILQGLEISVNAPVDILHDTNVRIRASLQAFDPKLTVLSFFSSSWVNSSSRVFRDVSVTLSDLSSLVDIHSCAFEMEVGSNAIK